MRSVYIHLFLAFALLDAVVSPPNALTHGALDERIAELTTQIKTNGTNGELNFQRGELYRQHGKWELALEDFDRAEKPDHKIAHLNLARGSTFFSANRFNEATVALDKFLLETPNHAEGLAMRARASAKLNQHSAAAAYFTRAINASTVPDPDYFLQRADTQIALGKASAALAGLDEGITRIGPIISLQLRAVEIETSAENYAAALARLNVLLTQSPQKETWLMRRGEILEKAGNFNKARQAFSEVLLAIEAKPAHRRQISLMKDLEARAHLALRRLELKSAAQLTTRKQP